MRNETLKQIAIRYGVAMPGKHRNSILAEIVVAAGGTVTDPDDRNQLLLDCLAVV